MKQVNIEQTNGRYTLDCTIDDTMKINQSYCIREVNEIIKNKRISDPLNPYGYFHFFILSFENMLIKLNINYSIDDFEFNFNIKLEGITINYVR